MNQKSDFIKFKKACLFWIDKFTLLDWLVEIEEVDLGVDELECRARTCFNWTQRTAKILWNTGYDSNNPDLLGRQSINDYALHEVIHILLNPLVMVTLDQKEFESSVVDAEEHIIVRKLMRVVNEIK